jgi:hypothetical protein
MKKPKWARALTVKEIRHLAEGSATGRASMRSLKANLEGQQKAGITCLECRHIANKLDIPIPRAQ